MTNDELEQYASANWQLAIPGRLWSWWLAGAEPDGPGLRRWQVWIWWTRQRGPQQRLLVAIKLLRGFIEAPHEVAGAVRRFGEKTEKVHGIPRATQFRQLLMLRWRFGVRPESYYKFQLFKPERLQIAPDFIEETGQLLQVIHRHGHRAVDERLFIDKEEFRLWCVANAIPTVDNQLEIKDGKVVARLTDLLPKADLFVKPTNWRQGRGTSRWRYVESTDGRHYTDGSGSALSAADFEEMACRTSLTLGRPYIVQLALTNHQSLRGYTNGALATIRLMTVRSSGKSAQPLVAALRMPTGDAVADNFDLGGIAAPIDLNTGICGPGIRKKESFPPDTVFTHPDTASVISELTIPWWRECVALTCRAHDLINARVPVIGWDVAVLDSGPVIVEPNHLPCHNLVQMPGGFPLGRGGFAKVVTSSLRECFLSGRVRQMSNDKNSG